MEPNPILCLLKSLQKFSLTWAGSITAQAWASWLKQLKKKSPMDMRTLWNCTAGKSLLPPNTNGWFSRTARFKWCQGLLLQLWNSHSQLLTLGFILGIMKRWGPSSASWNRIWLVWSGGNKKKTNDAGKMSGVFILCKWISRRWGYLIYFFLMPCSLFLLMWALCWEAGEQPEGLGMKCTGGISWAELGQWPAGRSAETQWSHPTLCGAEHSKVFLLE